MSETTEAPTPSTAEAASSQQTSDAPVTEQATEAQQEPQTAAPEKGKAESAAPKTPEKYEFQAREGRSYDPEVIAAYGAAAKELGLTQDAAQKLLDSVVPVMQDRQALQQKEVMAKWAEEATADKEIGGDKLQENLGIARKALDAFATPEFVRFLDESGLGNHPEMIRAWRKVGAAISEDSIVTGKGAPQPQRSTAEILFGTVDGEEG